MAEVVIYSTQICPYCERAKALLRHKKVDYTEIRVDQDETKKEEMLAKSNGQRTVPQIFINGQHIGGSDELYALHQQDKLDELLK